MAENSDVPKLEIIPIQSIVLNPNNPRGPNVRDTDPGFSYLKQSIKDRGILVPLIVKKTDGTYFLIDGERRFHAAREIGLESVPAHVLTAEMDDDAIQSTIFHIHMNWRQWSPAQELRASEPLYQRIVAQLGSPEAPEFLDLYIRETGTNRRKARNRLQFHRWPEEIKQEIYRERQKDYWYVIEIEDKIIEPARRNFPDYFERVPVDEVRILLFKKLQEKLVVAARDVRDAGVITTTPREGKERDAALAILHDLVTNVRTTFADAREAYIHQFPDAELPRLPGPRGTVGQVRRLVTILTGYVDIASSEEEALGELDKDEIRRALSELIQVASELTELLGE